MKHPIKTALCGHRFRPVLLASRRIRNLDIFRDRVRELFERYSVPN